MSTNSASLTGGPSPGAKNKQATKRPCPLGERRKFFSKLFGSRRSSGPRVSRTAVNSCSKGPCLESMTMWLARQ